MSERKLRKDSETNRQLMNSMSRTKKIYQFFAVIIATAFISSAITLTISADAPESAPNTVLDWEGLEAYKVNGVRYITSDNPDLLEETLTDLGSYGTTVVLGDGIYTFDHRINITGMVYLAVIGSPRAIIQWSDNLIVAGGGFYLYNCNKVILRGFGVYGPGSAATAMHGIDITRSWNVTVDDIYTVGWSEDCIVSHQSFDVTVKNCKLDFNKEGINIKGTQRAIVSDNIIRRTSEECIEIADSTGDGFTDKTKDVIVRNNVISESQSGIWLFNGVDRISVIGNHIYDLTNNGIVTSNSNVTYALRDVIISSNHICKIGMKGIWITNTWWEDVLIDGNFINDTGDSGIYISVAGKNATVSNNYVAWAGDSGTESCIWVQSTARTQVIGNSLYDGFYAELQINSCPNSTIQNNKMEGVNSYCGLLLVYSDNCTISANEFWGHIGKGIYADGNSDYLLIVNNRIKSPEGIRTTGTVDFAYVLANNFNGCATNYTLSGVGNVVSDNIG